MFAILLGKADDFDPLPIPLFLDAVPAGFPSPASDYCEKSLDLNELCTQEARGDLFCAGTRGIDD